MGKASWWLEQGESPVSLIVAFARQRVYDGHSLDFTTRDDVVKRLRAWRNREKRQHDGDGSHSVRLIEQFKRLGSQIFM